MIPIGIPSEEAKAEIETNSVTVEAKIRETVQYNFRVVQLFLSFYSSVHFAVFLQQNNFLSCPYLSI